MPNLVRITSFLDVSKHLLSLGTVPKQDRLPVCFIKVAHKVFLPAILSPFSLYHEDKEITQCGDKSDLLGINLISNKKKLP